ncbi:hypothetical protein M5K25_013428 [Dendrobium thyrsiflorum]|uniref:Jacalin-type lectin domain-containing protein n=1 Tax=Dendrobium thyrsiflorum TaxID=117978 RepID=A0ABD0UZQ1_DENTH
MYGKICIKLEPRGKTNSYDKQWDDGIGGRIKQIFVWYDEDFISGFQTIYECTESKDQVSLRKVKKRKYEHKTKEMKVVEE